MRITLTDWLTRSLTQSLIRSLTHSLTHSFCPLNTPAQTWIVLNQNYSYCTVNTAHLFFSHTDIDECSTGICSTNGMCKNNIGSYICSCNDGYRINENITECLGVYIVLTVRQCSILSLNLYLIANQHCQPTVCCSFHVQQFKLYIHSIKE